MKKPAVFAISLMLIFVFAACGGQQDKLTDMQSIDIDGKRCVVWQDRIYTPFCVVSKKDCGSQVGYVDGDTDDKISQYKGYPTDEWLVSWIPMDGGAMLLKEESVIDIPDGLEAEY